MSNPDVVDVVGVMKDRGATTVARRDRVVRHDLRVDPSEQQSALFDLARQCDDFDVRMEHLTVGDYCLDRGIVVERKTHADFAVSLVDGRLFPQAAKLARCPHRAIILIEGPHPARMPDVHPHALKGAIVSLAVMWRLPVLYARDPEDSLRILRCLADQLRSSDDGVLKRYDRKPKRLASRKLYMLQGLPGVGPALAHRLLQEFGSIERVVGADEEALMRVRGIGRQRAAQIRELIAWTVDRSPPFEYIVVMSSKTAETRADTTKDGRLNLSVDVDVADADVAVVVTVTPVAAGSDVDENGWPEGFFDRVAGSMPELRRGSQGDFEERLPLE